MATIDLPPPGPFPNPSQNPIFQRLNEILGFSPTDVIVLPSVEMDFVEHVLAASEYNRDVQPVCKPRFVIDAPTCTIVPVRTISHNKSRTSNLRYDLVVNLVGIRFLVDSQRLVTCGLNGRSDTSLIETVDARIKSHRNKRLRRVNF